MITNIETALAAWLQGLLDAASLAKPAVALPAVSQSIAPMDRTVVICLVHDLPHDGGNHYRAMLRFTVESPADVKGVTPATHAAVEAVVSGAFKSANDAALNTALTAHAAGFSQGGYFVNGWQPGTQQSGWVPHFDVILGVVPA